MKSFGSARGGLNINPVRVAWIVGGLTLLMVVAAVALSPLRPDRYQAAIAAIGTVVTVLAIGVAVVGMAADHARQRSDATLNFINDVLDQDREKAALINRWLKGKGESSLSKELATDLRTSKKLEVERDALRSYLNHLERLALGVRAGIFEGEIVALLSRSRIVNTRHRYAAFMDAATDTVGISGLPNRNYEHLRWLVDDYWKAPVVDA
jgi:hypothetical protein